MEIVDNRTVSAARVYRGIVMNVFGEWFSIDLVIPLRGLKVIIRMDWLGFNVAMID